MMIPLWTCYPVTIGVVIFGFGCWFFDKTILTGITTFLAGITVLIQSVYRLKYYFTEERLKP